MLGHDNLFQKKQEQLNKEIRVGSTHEASQLRRQNEQLYNQQAVEQDISALDQILGSKALQLEDQERAELQVRRGGGLQRSRAWNGWS